MVCAESFTSVLAFQWLVNEKEAKDVAKVVEFVKEVE
jgi:hypothetical protein